MGTMEEIKQIRLNNLKTLLNQRFAGSQARMAEATERNPAQIRAILNPLGIGGRWIGEKVARDIEVKLGLVTGWMDVPAYARNTEAEAPLTGDNFSAGPSIRGRVPLIGWIQAGNYTEIVDNFHPGDAEEWMLTTERIRQHTFALRVQGDSMTPRFPPGTILIVEPEESVQPGDFVVARINSDTEATFKQLVKDGSRLYLRPLNPQYPILPVDEQTHIVGPVITAIAKMK